MHSAWYTVSAESRPSVLMRVVQTTLGFIFLMTKRVNFWPLGLGWPLPLLLWVKTRPEQLSQGILAVG